MTVLESPIARSEYNHRIRNKLEKASEHHAKRRARSQLATRLRPQSRAKDVKSKPTTQTNAEASKQASSKEPAAGKEAQEPSLSSKAVGTTTSSKATGAASGKESAEPTLLKWWDVSGLQLRQYKQWVAVRINNTLIRKFLFKEWQDEAIAKQIATEFAKQAAKKLLDFRFNKTKKEKLASLAKSGVVLASTLTVSQMQAQLEKAGRHSSNEYACTQSIFF